MIVFNWLFIFIPFCL